MGIVTQVEPLTKLSNDQGWVVILEHLDLLDVLTIELDLEDADGLVNSREECRLKVARSPLCTMYWRRLLWLLSLLQDRLWWHELLPLGSFFLVRRNLLALCLEHLHVRGDLSVLLLSQEGLSLVRPWPIRYLLVR